jgi:hypothetical protein
MGAMIGEADENWRESEESLELAVLEAVREEDLAKKTSFCIGKEVKRGCR